MSEPRYFGCWQRVGHGFYGPGTRCRGFPADRRATQSRRLVCRVHRGTAVTTIAPLPLSEVPALCHWRRGLAPDQTHTAYHYGSACPYDVVAAVLAGAPDPRDDVNEWRVDISTALTPKGTVPLSLNDRGMHWAAHAKAVARVKASVRNAVMAAEIPHLDYVHVEMHYRPKTNRFRDVDNTVATLKVAIDALHHRDTSEHAPVPYDPIIDGDDPRYVSWTPPILHPWERGREPALWLVLRSWT